MTKRFWVQTPTMETISQAPFIRIKAWNKNCGKTLTWHCCMCCNPANGRVDFEEWSAYKIQLHGIEWIVSLSADWDQSQLKKKYSTQYSLFTSARLEIATFAADNSFLKRKLWTSAHSLPSKFLIFPFVYNGCDLKYKCRIIIKPFSYSRVFSKWHWK